MTIAMSVVNNKPVDAFEVGWLFVQEYYTHMNKDPSRLHCFYNKKSSFIHGQEGEPANSCTGQTEIHERILDLEFQDCRVLVSNVDSQASLSGGIVVQVLGEMSNKGSASHKFAQTFFLAEQPNGYYVLNDIFRFLKEDIDDNEYDESMVHHPTLNHHHLHHVDVVPQVSVEQSVSASTVPSMNKHISSNATIVNGSSSVSVSGHVVQPTVVAPVVPIVATPATTTTTTTTTATATTATKSATTIITKHEWVEPPTEPNTTTTWVEPPNKTAKSTPIVVEKQQGNEGSKPKTWAIAAGTTPLAPVAVVYGNPNPSSKSSPAKKEVESTPPVTIASSSQATNATSSTSSANKKEEIPVVGYSRKHENRKSVDSAEAAEREKNSIYIRGLVDGIGRKAIIEAFGKFGTIVKVDVVSTKNIAFVEYTNSEAASKIIGTTVTVNNVSLNVEERKRVFNYHHKGKNYANGNPQREGKGQHRSGSRHRGNTKQQQQGDKGKLNPLKNQ